MAASSDPRPPPVRLRASRACKTCHDRRVKCDAFERGTPCSRCRENGLMECHLIKSKRGTYSRRRSRAADDPTSAPTSARLETPSATQSQHHREGHSNEPDMISGNGPGDMQLCNQDSPCTSSGHSITPTNPAPPSRPPVDPHGSTASLQPPDLPALDLTTPESQFSDTSRNSSHDITWMSMFEHVLNSRRDQERQTAIDKCSITYLGETFPLAAVLEDLKQEGRIRLHHPGPPVSDESSGAYGEPHHPAHVLPEDLAFLEAKGAFEHPDADLLGALTSTFVNRIYPCYPIVNRREFMRQLKDNKVPWLLLHSFCFISATFCPLSVLHRAKFTDRKQARMHFYNKAKALFDIGYEVNKIVLLQSVIILAFWVGSPNEYRNFYSWNSTGTTIAEAMGLHRSMSQSNLKQEDISLLRRLWWVLVIRDASCGALVGRPFRINMYFCDTEMLTMGDFQDDMDDLDFVQHPLRDTFGLYQIHMAKLSLILRDIVKQKYDMKNGRFATEDLNQKLTAWKRDLPKELCLPSSASSVASEAHVFSQTLAMAYDHHLILANLDEATFTLPTPQEGPGEMVMSASAIIDASAHRILDLACSIARTHVHATMPHECYPSLFLAETVFYSQMRSPQQHRASLGKSAVNTCQMVWHSIMDAWDSAPWVMKLFDNLISNAQQDINVDRTSLSTANLLAEQPPPTFDMSDLEIGGISDIWQSHPMLSNMFDFPMNHTGANGLSFGFTPIGDEG